MNINHQRTKKILLIRTDRFGEFILNIPVITAIKEKFKDAKITVLISPNVEELVINNPAIAEVIRYDANTQKGILSTLKIIKELKRRRFDLAIILNPQKKFNIITFFSGIPIRMGYNRKWPFLLTHRLEDRKYLGEKHEVEYNLDLARLIGADTQDKTLYIPIQSSDEKFVERIFNDFNLNKSASLIAIHPWTSNPLKQWPVDNFIELIKRLLEKFNIKITIIGGKENIDISNQFCQKIGNSVINLTGIFSLRQLAAFFKRCRLLISNDSGPMHLASAVNTPVVALFRNTPGVSSKRWGPWGENHLVIEKDSLDKITVEEVLDKVKILLKR